MATERRKSPPLRIRLDRSKPPPGKQPWVDIRGSKSKLAEARNALAQTDTDTRDDLRPLVRYLNERDYRLRYKHGFQHGDFRALLDFIAAQGVAALQRDWVLLALRWHEKRAKGNVNALRLPVAGRKSRRESAISRTEMKLRQEQSAELLRAVGRALVCEGRGRNKRFSATELKQIASAYRELLPKVQQCVRATREALGSIERMTPSDRRSVAKGYSQRFDLPFNTCASIITNHHDGSRSVDRQPSWIARRAVAQQFGCDTRIVEKAIASRPKGARGATAPTRRK